MKHRTQILLEPPQYAFLQSLARREKTSLGSLIRRFVEEKRSLFFQKRGKDPLAKLFGSFKDSTCTSENYADFLYGKIKD